MPDFEDDIKDQPETEAPPTLEEQPELTPEPEDYDPVSQSKDEFERLLGMPHKNLDTAILSHGFTLDRIFHRLAMYGGGSKAKTIDKTVMELALQTQLQFRRTYETIKRLEREEREAVEKYERSRYGHF